MSNPTEPHTDRATIALQCDGVSVEVDPVGASLIQLSVGDLRVVPAVSGADLAGKYVGSVIAPWPNRITDGRYVYGGQEYQLECNESSRGNALHGFTADQTWEVLGHSDSEVTLGTGTGGHAGYPWQVGLQVTYRVESDGVSVQLLATNTSDTSAPFGAAFHPYLVLPTGDPTVWTLTMAAHSVVVPDRERLFPVEEVDVAAAGLDFRHGAPLDAAFVDHAFGGFSNGVTAELSDSDGRVIRVEASEECPWMQVHKPVDGPLVGSIVLEPQTCPPNAFSSGRDVIELGAGDSVSMSWRLRVQTGGEAR